MCKGHQDSVDGRYSPVLRKRPAIPFLNPAV
jgi:hypothetical protein